MRVGVTQVCNDEKMGRSNFLCLKRGWGMGVTQFLQI